MTSPRDLSTRSPGGDGNNPAEQYVAAVRLHEIDECKFACDNEFRLPAGAIPTAGSPYRVDDFGFDNATRLSFQTDSTANAFATNCAEGSK